MTIRIDQPQPFDLVGRQLLVAGIAGGGFEGEYRYRVHEGHDERTGGFLAGGGAGVHGQFQFAVDLSGASFKLDRLFVELFHIDPSDGGEVGHQRVAVLYGPLIVPSYWGYHEHIVAPGDTLWGIASYFYGDGNKYDLIARANAHIIADPDVILPGMWLRVPAI